MTTDSSRLARIALRTLLLVIVWRAALALALFVGLSLSGEYAGAYVHDSKWLFIPGHYFANGLVRWDSYWYDLIATRGYTQAGPEAAAVAFFPLYPMLTRLLEPLFGNHLVAGLVLSNLCLWIGLVYVYRIGLLFTDAEAVERGLVLLLCYPGSFFFSAYYTEGLYLALTAALCYYGYTRQYLWAGVAGALAAACRPTAMGLFASFLLALCFDALRDRRWPEGRALWLLLVPAGLLAYMAWLGWSFGDPLAFAHAQSHWERHAALPWDLLQRKLAAVDWSLPRHMINTQTLVNCIVAIGFLLLGAWLVLRQSRWGGVLAGTYVLVGVLQPLVAGSTDSMVRYTAVLFPAFLWAGAALRAPMGFALAVGAFSMGCVVYGLGFMNKFWVV